MEKETIKIASITSRWAADEDEDLFEVLTESGTIPEEASEENVLQ